LVSPLKKRESKEQALENSDYLNDLYQYCSSLSKAQAKNPAPEAWSKIAT